MPKSSKRAPASAPTFRITMRHHTATDADASECSKKEVKSIRGGGTPRFARRGRHSRHRCLPRSAWATFGCAESSYWHLRCQILNHLFGGSKLLFRATLLPFLQRSRNRLVADSIRQVITWHFFQQAFLSRCLFWTTSSDISDSSNIALYVTFSTHFIDKIYAFYVKIMRWKQRIKCNIFKAFYRQKLRI